MTKDYSYYWVAFTPDATHQVHNATAVQLHKLDCDDHKSYNTTRMTSEDLFTHFGCDPYISNNL